MRTAAIRNVLIIAAVAAMIAFLPGGGTTAAVITTAISLAFLASLGWVATVMYRQHRTSLYSVSDNRRAVVYVAVGVLAITLTATSRMWHSSGGSVAWLVLMAGAIYAIAAIVIAARRY